MDGASSIVLADGLIELNQYVPGSHSLIKLEDWSYEFNVEIRGMIYRTFKSSKMGILRRIFIS